MIHEHTGRWMLTRERNSRILELRETLLSFQTGLSLVNAAVVCAILASISDFKPSSDATESRHLKLVTVSSFCQFSLISLLMPLVLFVISLVFSALISISVLISLLSQCLLRAFVLKHMRKVTYYDTLPFHDPWIQWRHLWEEEMSKVDLSNDKSICAVSLLDSR